MKKTNFIIHKIILIVLFLGLNSCETTELNLTDDPSAFGIEVADTERFFNSTQLEFARFFEEASTIGMDVTRMTQMGGSDSYQNNYTSNELDDMWEVGYADFLQDAKFTKQIASENGFNHVVAVTQILEAYVIMTLVDYFGDIPYSQALDSSNSNPIRDTDSDVYAAANGLLLDALAKLDEESIPLSEVNDLYYNGNIIKWKKLANSLRIRYALQTRHVSNSNSLTIINDIISDSNNYISSSNDDFVFNWSTDDSSGDSRHPKFTLGYDQGRPRGYQSNYFMWALHQEKGFDDPRIRFYFYRKTLTIPDDTTVLPCVNQGAPSHYIEANAPFCNAGDGYMGRDHGVSQATPADDDYQTIMGIYPFGGKFDDDSHLINPGKNAGLKGEGISPVITASSIDFMLAEINLTLTNNIGAAKINLIEGINKSISKVTNFSNISSTLEPTTAEINNYIAFVENQFDSSSNKLNVVMKESYLSLWGNGIDSYNNYRRTGLPNNLQPSISANPGSFMNLLLYPASHVSNNDNANQRSSVGEKVFWAEPTAFDLNF